MCIHLYLHSILCITLNCKTQNLLVRAILCIFTRVYIYYNSKFYTLRIESPMYITYSLNHLTCYSCVFAFVIRVCRHVRVYPTYILILRVTRQRNSLFSLQYTTCIVQLFVSRVKNLHWFTSKCANYELHRFYT